MGIGTEDSFTIKTVQIISADDNNQYFAQTFNYAFTVVMFFALVAMFISMLMRIVKDAGDD